MPSKSKPLKKLLHFYWEICPKTNPDGKLKQEMILVWYVHLLRALELRPSNAIRNDLQHPNEYVCGMTLRFLCKLREPELLEPLLPPCRACLVSSHTFGSSHCQEHRHSYVRKNAVFAIYSIYHHSEHLIPDAPDLILTFLQAVYAPNSNPLINRRVTKHASVMLLLCYPIFPIRRLLNI